MRVREASSLSDLDAATSIQKEVWSVEDIEIVGRIQLKASQHAGGSVLVAEADDGTIAGFSYAFPAFVKGVAFWHSDMLAVRPAFRGTGVGQALKWAQRDHALESGIRVITWTFDPMQAGNAHLNIELLGATANEYLPNFYGVTTSTLHHGLPTDRLLAEWNLESPNVVAKSRGEDLPSASTEAIVKIPADWNLLVTRDAGLARAEQERVARELPDAFHAGLTATGFDKPSASYLLTRVDRP